MKPWTILKFFTHAPSALDGSYVDSRLGQLFQTLNTADDKRSRTLDEQVAAFPYVNGKLFEELLPMADFSAAMRAGLERGAAGSGNAGLLDFVAAWYVKAAKYMELCAANRLTSQRSSAAPSFQPTASPKANRLVYFGTGCWRRAFASTLRTARSGGTTKLGAKSPCIA